MLISGLPILPALLKSIVVFLAVLVTLLAISCAVGELSKPNKSDLC